MKKAFENVRLLKLKAGEILIQTEAPSSFVYIPLEDGLKIILSGGYPPALAQLWIPIGNTGVIRGAARNATVTAVKDISLIIIPRETYLRYWHCTYTFEEFRSEMLSLPDSG